MPSSLALGRAHTIAWILLIAFALACAPSPEPQEPVPEQPRSSICTLAPGPPDGAPDDWVATVNPNCFDNLERLGLWTGGTRALSNGESPEPDFAAIAPASLGSGNGPQTIVVLVHGWAPGYRSKVEEAGFDIRWWSTDLAIDGVWPSAWAWVPTSGTDPALAVTTTGVFQEIQKHAPDASVVGFSWTDDSATDGSFTDLVQVYRSEAYTNINGLRLAAALEEAVADSFWDDPGSVLHIIGHSHGSKVATVATLTLQQSGRRVDHLTILDSPESEVTLMGNGANLIGFYLNQLQILDPKFPTIGQTFVDNYVSEFGAGFAGPVLANVVETQLDPSQIYRITEAGDKHSYSAAWYGGAAIGASNAGLPPVGLDWPPPPDFLPALNQLWTGGVNENEQWRLTLDSPIGEVREFTQPSLPIDDESRPGCVQGSGNSGLTLTSTASGEACIYEGGYQTPDSNQFGIAFTVDWTNPLDGDYLVFTVNSPDEGEFGVQEVILVMDGRSAPVGRHPVSFNADISSNPLFDVKFFAYFLTAPGSASMVNLSDFRAVISKCTQNCLPVAQTGETAAEPGA